MNNICPFDLRHTNTNGFFDIFHISKAKRWILLAFLATMVNTFMHLISKSGNKFDDNEILPILKMMKRLKKSIVIEIAEKNLRVVKGKKPVSFQCYYKTCQLLIEDGSPDSIFRFLFFDNAMEFDILF